MRSIDRSPDECIHSDVSAAGEIDELLDVWAFVVARLGVRMSQTP